MTPREHFEREGKLFRCPNKSHYLSIGRLFSQWTIAKKGWSALSDQGHLQTHFLRIGKSEDTQGRVFYTVIVWKLSVLIAFI